MNNNELIKSVFRTMMDEYGFSLTRDVYSPEFMGNAEAVFVSDKTGIKIVVDRSQVFINIGNLLLSEADWFELEDVIHFYSPRMKGVYLFQRSGQSNSDIESQAKWIVYILHRFCEPLLKGDFSSFDQIKEIERKRVKEMKETFQKIYPKKVE